MKRLLHPLRYGTPNKRSVNVLCNNDLPPVYENLVKDLSDKNQTFQKFDMSLFIWNKSEKTVILMRYVISKVEDE